MRKIYTSFILLLCLSIILVSGSGFSFFIPAKAEKGYPILQAGSILAAEDWESGDFNGGTGWLESSWTISDTGVIVFDSEEPIGTYHVRMHKTGQYLYRSVNLQGLSNVHLVFDWKGRSFEEDGNMALVEVNDNAGSGWVEVFRHSDNNFVYNSEDIDLSGYSVQMSSNFTVRFSLVATKGRDYAYFDNIQFQLPDPTPEPTGTPEPTSTPEPTPEPTPGPGNAILIEAEDYVDYYDTTPGNEGGAYKNDDVDIEDCHDGSPYSGYDVGWTASGEWLDYTITVPATGLYTLYLRVARGVESDGAVHIEVNGQNVTGTVMVPGTGGWKIWEDVAVPSISLTAGEASIKYVLESDDVNLNFIYFASEENPPDPTPTPGKDFGPTPTPPPYYTGPVEHYGLLQVQGNRIYDSNGEPVQLRGWNSHGIQWFPFIAGHTIPHLAYDYNVEIVRIAMYINEESGYLFNQTYMKARVNEMVQDSINAGIYVIVDWHLHGNPTPYTEEAKIFFAEMSSQLWGSSPNVIWEICNEPDKFTSWNQVKAYADTVIPEIRANSPDNLIIVGTPYWCQKPADALSDPVIDDNVAYSFHFYACGHGAEQLENLDDARDGGLAIFASEWGTGSYDVQLPDLCLSASDSFIDFLEERSIPWANWSFSTHDVVTSALKPNTQMAGPWTDSDLTESGLWVKNRINSPLLDNIYSSSLSMAGFGPVQGTKYYAEATVTVNYADNGPVPAGTKVKGIWSGALNRSAEGITDSNGEVTFQSGKVRNGGTFIFTITDILTPGYAWNPAYPDSVNSESIILP